MTRPSLSERLWAKVEKRGPDECWPWTARRNEWGYGEILVNGKKVLAHRLLWKMLRGPIPEEMSVCHSCDNPPCENPAHLWLGTHQDNMRDRDSKGRLNTAPPERSPGHRLTWDEVREIRGAYAERRIFQGVLAAHYGVASSTIGRIVIGKTWRELGMLLLARGKNPPGPRRSEETTLCTS